MGETKAPGTKDQQLECELLFVIPVLFLKEAFVCCMSTRDYNNDIADVHGHCINTVLI